MCLQNDKFLATKDRVLSFKRCSYDQWGVGVILVRYMEYIFFKSYVTARNRNLPSFGALIGSISQCCQCVQLRCSSFWTKTVPQGINLNPLNSKLKIYRNKEKIFNKLKHEQIFNLERRKKK